MKRERGERLRAQRLAVKTPGGKRLLQADLGRRVGLTPQQISKYESGKDLISAGWAYRFARALGCSFQAIFIGGFFELAEARETFLHADQAADDLPDLARLAVERLTLRRRRTLQDVIVELLDEEAAAAPPPSVAGAEGIL